MSLTENQKYWAKYKMLDNEFYGWKSFYKEVTEFIWPVGGVHLDEESLPNDKPKIHTGMLSDAAEYANKIYGAGYQGGLCSPSRRWFELTLKDKDLAKFPPVKEWLDHVETVLYQIFQSSNFYQASHIGFEEQGAFGMEAQFMMDDPTDVVRFFPMTAGEYRVAANYRKQVDTIYRKIKMTAIQMAKMFGKNKLSDRVTSVLDRNPFTWFTVLHIIEPRDDRDTSKVDANNMPWKSVWVEDGVDDRILRESGFNRFPAVCARSATRGQSPYGYGPGHAVLGRAKVTQEMEKAGLTGLHLMVRPPMITDSSFKGILDMTPAAHNEGGSDIRGGARALYEVNLPLQALEAKINQIEARIERSFYNDLFLMITNMQRVGRDPTATEILERKEEKMLMLGPSVERQAKEKLDPIIDFTFDAAIARGNLIKPPPQELQGMPLEVEYVSILAQAQKLAVAQGLRAYLAEVERVAAVNPETMIKSDLFEYLDQYGTVLGIPTKIMRPQEEVEAELAAIREAQAKQAQQEEYMAQTEMARNLGSASTADGTALADLKQSMAI
ncbi:head-tail connector protein [Candidatus Pacearchaeota archaeon]|nr:head-tail connector protein [Candidatus Pacearchaeota archaeon]